MTPSELRRCDTDQLGLARPGPPRSAMENNAAGDGDRHRQACGGVAEVQAAAILRVARRAAEEGLARPPDRGAGGSLSVRRSLDGFLRRRREARRQRDGASPSPSSSCLTRSQI